RNFGQTAAFRAAVENAFGDSRIGMYGDRQNDPHDIPAMLEKMEEGYDVVSGWRRERKDKTFTRRIPSKVANWLASRISGVHLNDFGCSLKAYRAHIIQDVHLYGEMHRFIPVYCSWIGGRVCEMVVNHRPRVAGVSKYGLRRIFKVSLDLLLIRFLDRYMTKPLHFFGGAGLLSIGTGTLAGLYALYLKIFEGVSFIATPLPLLVTLLLMLG
ncbi:unnamed protein product, partial [Laminaria digitata]